ncbi:hypothetical protein AMATHDRAFT_134704 [Amanita thiersii Skay4041]|uniref:Cytochrome P450 n=1 Tax=Amanita thiersii Skay4041 TaxID=703135 RepID=A0A2A9P0Y4_9AGAR|nr:hypothetical protein AMATHDRAFT_134704 [Amanita thiersii Skay4041]
MIAFSAISLAKSFVGIAYRRFVLRHVPGPPPPSLLWGEEWHLYTSHPGSLYSSWHKNYGKVVRFSGVFGHQILSIIDPSAISFILGEGAYSFPKPQSVRAWFKALLGEGILWVEGKSAHDKQRKLLAPALSQQSVRDLVPVFLETSNKLVMQWLALLDKSRSEAIEIEVTNWVGRFALDTISRAAFSYDFDCLSGRENSLFEALDGLTNNENKLSSFYMRALFWLFPSVLVTGKKGEMIRRTKRELGRIGAKMWEDAKIISDTSDRTLMARMLRADHVSTLEMSEEEIVAQMRTIISAGYETVSAIISWLLYEIACNPTIQTALRTEVTMMGDITLGKINTQCPLLDAILKETLRLHPAILENHHEAAHTVTVPLAEPLSGTSDMYLTIPKGTILLIPVNVIQQDSEEWGADAETFKPERWLNADKRRVGARRDLLAFSEGPRSCIGKAFALAEIKVFTVILLQQFEFSCNHHIEPFQSFVVRPRIKGQSWSSLPLVVKRV